MKSQASFRDWEYAKVGDNQRNLDPNFLWAPAFFKEMYLAREFLNRLTGATKILVVGYGQGILVKEFAKKSLNIQGLDLNNESSFAKRGNILDMSYSDDAFDVVLLLDVFEHLSFIEQPRALKKFNVFLKIKASFSFLFQAKLI